MVGIGGAVWLGLSVRAVREDEVEERLVVEDEWEMRPERRLFASFSDSLVVREMDDRRFAKLRSRLGSSTSSLLLLEGSSSPEEDEAEELDIGGEETTMPRPPLEMMDGGGEGAAVSES